MQAFPFRLLLLWDGLGCVWLYGLGNESTLVKMPRERLRACFCQNCFSRTENRDCSLHCAVIIKVVWNSKKKLIYFLRTHASFAMQEVTCNNLVHHFALRSNSVLHSQEKYFKEFFDCPIRISSAMINIHDIRQKTKAVPSSWSKAERIMVLLMKSYFCYFPSG